MRAGFPVRAVFGLGLAVLLAGHGSRASGQGFQLIDRPPATVTAYAQGISYDGGVVAGRSIGTGIPDPGWYWTPQGGRVDVVGPGLPPNTGSYGISGDGNVLVGETSNGQVSAPVLAYRYDRTTGEMTNLGALSGTLVQSRATGASFDGSAVVGFAIDNFSLNNSRAFRWTAADGMQSLGVTRPGQHNHSEAAAVSADGSTVIGWSQGFSGSDAFRWTSTTGMTILPMLPGATYTRALGSNFNADIIVGVSDSPQRGVLWRDGGAFDLGTAEGFNRSLARAVSDDGTIVVGKVSNGPASIRHRRDLARGHGVAAVGAVPRIHRRVCARWH